MKLFNMALFIVLISFVVNGAIEANVEFSLAQIQEELAKAGDSNSQKILNHLFIPLKKRKGKTATIPKVPTMPKTKESSFMEFMASGMLVSTHTEKL